MSAEGESNPGAVVLDASAVLKLVLEERDSERFRAWYQAQVEAGTPLLAPPTLHAEVGRVVQREFEGLDAGAKQAVHKDLLTGIVFLPVDLDRATDWACAEQVDFFDALYVSTAIGSAGLCTFDARMAKAAARHKVPVVRP